MDHRATDGPVSGNPSQGWLRCGGQVTMLRHRSEQRDWSGGLDRGAPRSAQLQVLKDGSGAWGALLGVAFSGRSQSLLRWE